MKTTSHPAAAKAVLSAACGLFTTMVCFAQSNGNVNLIPAVPDGWLTAFPTMVQTGTKPTLTWSITYPSTVDNYIHVQAPGKITTTEQLDVEVRVVGAGVTTGGSDGTNSNWVPTEASISLDGGSHKIIFFGTNRQVDPDALVWAKRVNKNAVIKFGGRYHHREWGPTYTSDSGGNNIRTLVNGEYPPTAFPLHTSPTLKPFMNPYLDAEGRVKIGPLDVLVMMELTQPDSNVNSPFYNLQDLVLLVTFRPKSNNGHGNNIDGIDSSNPGSAPFMQYDTNPNIDDEGKGGGAFPRK
jgi:hypothetical protein